MKILPCDVIDFFSCEDRRTSRFCAPKSCKLKNSTWTMSLHSVSLLNPDEEPLVQPGCISFFCCSQKYKAGLWGELIGTGLRRCMEVSRRLFNLHPLTDPVWTFSDTLAFEMRLRCLFVLAVLCAGASAQGYQPPLLLAAPPPPPPQPIVHNSYQPPLPQPQQAAAPPAPFHHLESSAPLSSAPSALSAERTYSTHTQILGSAAASEIEPNKLPSAQEKDNKNDEYVVYYYYYYDNDTATTGNQSNPSLNFDDIPSLENYDERKEPENALTDSVHPKNTSQPRIAPAGVDNTVIRADALPSQPEFQPPPQPVKPVSNVFRYGSNEVPRFPVIPNFVLSETTTIPPTTTTVPTVPAFSDEIFSTTPVPPVSLDEPEDDTLNNVLDSTPDLKDIKEEETTTTTTQEPTTTTEIPTTTTTTEKPRRRPSLGGGSRRQLTNRPSFSSTRNRSPSRGDSSSSSSTTSTTTTTSTPSTRRSFQSNNNRFRSRPGGFRGSSSRTTEASEDKSTTKAVEATTASSTTTTTRSRFGGAATRGRFQSSRSRASSTTRAPASATSATPRTTSRTTSRPRPNLITRNRPARPGFLRPRPGSEPEEPSTTTPAPEEEIETSPEANELSSTAEEEVEETSEEEEGRNLQRRRPADSPLSSDPETEAPWVTDPGPPSVTDPGGLESPLIDNVNL
ncbi:hypothetical protein HNY73_017556 [Argiope bruennichi]|uniref:Uncharacterized protein n=1 Tax=Argiope bruennichi TaxID=94029 RepID=A0A8T0EBG2_ARGBR|nr:hypothetical protein HNY73_017556 [Argiope bruennichi]